MNLGLFLSIKSKTIKIQEDMNRNRSLFWQKMDLFNFIQIF